MPAVADEDRRARLGAGQRAPDGQPGRQRPGRRGPVRHRPLLVALAEHPDGLAVVVDVAEVEPAQLGHPDAGGVQQLEDGHVPGGARSPAVRATCSASVSIAAASALSRVGGSDRTRFGDRRAAAGSCIQPPRLQGPATEHPDGRGPPLQRPAGPAAGLLVGQPGAQRPDGQPGQVPDAEPVQVGEQVEQVAAIGPDGVVRQVPVPQEVLDVVVHRLLQHRRQILRRGGLHPTTLRSRRLGV